MNLSLITWISVAFIIGIFGYFLILALKMNKVANIFHKASENDDSLNSISETKFATLKEAYLRSTKIQIDNLIKRNTPAEVYFTIHTVCAASGINLKVLDAGSGILVGLGLLGTFLGLTLGINGFETSDSEKIQTSIQSLLDGMGTAFITSLAGMGLSLIYTGLEKMCRNKLDNAIYAFTEKIDSIYYIDDSTLSHYQQKKLTDDFYSRIASLIRNESSKIVKTIIQQTSYTTPDNEEVAISDSIREILLNNEEQTTALKSFSTDLALELNQGFDEVLSRQMQEKILPLMQNVDTTTRIVVEHIDKMAEQISSPATDMINTVVNELKTSVNTMIDEFQTNISNTTTKELSDLAHSLGAATDLMMNFPSNMVSITSSLKQTVTEVQKAILEISHNSAASNDATIQKMQEQIAFVTKSISESIAEVKNVMNNISIASETSSQNIADRLSNASSHMSQFMQESMTSIGENLQETMRSITEEISKRQLDFMAIQESSVAELKKSVLELSDYSKSSSREVIETIQAGSKSMVVDLNSTMDTINQRVNTTLDILSSSYIDVSQKLNTSIESITQKVSNQIGLVMDNVSVNYSEVLVRQKETLDDTLTLLQEFESTIGKLKETNSTINVTMSSFIETQDHISTSVSNLHTVSDHLKTTTENFCASQDEYGQQIKTLETSTKEKIKDITELMTSMGSTTKRQSEDFEIIRMGLGDIFKQIESGLDNYSKTVRTSLQDYLDSYTNSLTKTTDSLASTIHMQNEMVEALIETVKPGKKR